MLSNALYDRASSVCRVLAVFLSVVLAVGLAPLPAYAETDTALGSIDGDNVETTTSAESESAAEEASDAQYVAKIGDQGYATLQAAVDAAQAGETVKLTSDVTENITVAAGKDVVLDLNGNTVTNSTNDHTVCVLGTLVVRSLSEGGRIVSTNNCGICVSGGGLTIESGTVEAQEMALLLVYAGQATVTGGTLTAKDNAVIGTNGVSGRGGNSLTITGGEFVGGIQTSDYVACGIYVANDDNVNVSGGTFRIEGGAGIVARAGIVNLSGDVVVETTGNATGKVGDSRIVVPCSAVVFDSEAKYPGLAESSKLTVSGGSFASEAAVASAVGAQSRIAISGGTFNKNPGNDFVSPDYVLVDSVEGQYTVAAVTAELSEAIEAAEAAIAGIETNSEAVIAGDKYVSAEAKQELETAIAAAQVALESGSLTLDGVHEAAKSLAEATAAFNAAVKRVWGVSFNAGAEGGAQNVPAGQVPVIDGENLAAVGNPTRDGYLFEAWYLGDTEYDFNAQVTSDIMLTAHWVEKEVAAVGVQTFPSLAKAIEAADPNASVKLLQDVEEAGVSIDKPITIDLNGKDYTVTGSGSVSVTAKVEVVNSGMAPAHIATAISNAYAVQVSAGGDLTVGSGAVITGPYGIYVQGAKVSVAGGEVFGTTYGILAAEGAQVAISAGKVEATDANSYGINARDAGSKLTISGGEVIGGSHGVMAAGGARLSMSEGSVQGRMGIGIDVSDNGLALISGGTVRSNTLDLNALAGGKIEVSGGYFGHQVDSQYCASGVTPKAEAEASGEYAGLYTVAPAEHLVVFVNEDGEELYSMPVAHGEMPAYDGDTPTKDATAEFTYTFDGWTPDVAPATADATYTAKYAQHKRSYQITFKDADGTVLANQTVEYGATPAYEGSVTPTKDPDQTSTYHWNEGWEPVLAPVSGDAEYTATFDSAPRQYTVRFVTDEGEEISAAQYAYGTPASEIARPAAPDKPQTASSTYTFSGWDPVIADVSADATYTAYYRPNLRNYTVTWQNADGSIIGTSQVAYGKMPAYDGEAPTKEATAEFTYTFDGWTPGLSAVANDVTYRASFKGERNKYSVKFLNEDGSLLEEGEWQYGYTPSLYGPAPTKADTTGFTYTFAGWDKELVPVTEDAVYKAQFSDQKKTFTVRWLDDDGTVLETDSGVEYGETPTYHGAAPEKEATAQYTYSFKGWGTVDPVTGNVSYRAQYESTVNTYRVTFVDEDGKTLAEQTLAYGETPQYGGETPTKDGDDQYSYQFETWDPEITDVVGDATYTAKFESLPNYYSVSFVDEDGTVLQSGYFAYGSTPEYTRATPAKAASVGSTFAFDGWSPDIESVTGPATYTAQYKESPKTYVVTYLNWDGSLYRTYPGVEHGSLTPVPSANPTRLASDDLIYTFDAWEPTVSPIAYGPATYQANFTSAPRAYVITFLADDGTVIDSADVAVGEMPVEPAAPAKAADEDYTYAFAGWDAPVVAVTGDAVYTATYDARPIDKIAVESGDQALAAGSTFKVRATANGTVAWSSSNPAVARVSADGTVTAVAAGTARISATCGTATDSFTVTVTAPASSTNTSGSGTSATTGSSSTSTPSASSGTTSGSGSGSSGNSGSTTTTRNVTNNYYTTNTSSAPAAAAPAVTAPASADNADADDNDDADGTSDESANADEAAETDEPAQAADPAAAARNAAQAIADEANPLDSGISESIAEDENPLDSGLESASAEPGAEPIVPWWILALAAAVAAGGIAFFVAAKRRKNAEEEDERLRA